MNINELRIVYFIGIGGIGMSALARYFKGLGAEVHGYDKTETSLTKKLVEEGMQIHYNEDVSKIPEGVDLVVWTPAVPKEHAELQYFLKREIPVKKRSEVLGIISQNRRCIALAGTHGKTTTSSLTAHLLRAGGVDAAAFLGGIAQNCQSNCVNGQSDWVVVEADEYDRSFLRLHPEIGVISSMDPDHLDIYGDADSVHDTGYLAFAKQVSGTLYVQHSWIDYFDKTKVRSYGVEGGDYRAENLRVEDGYFVFDYKNLTQTIDNLQFPMPGRHNVENATAAISIALQVGVAPEAIRAGLLSFKGIKRRFEFIVRTEKTVYIDDYGHHPTELRAAIGAAKQLFPNRKVTGIFQPHLYTRTRDFVDGFAEALDGLDEILLLDIYPARELPIPGVTSEIIFNKMKNPNKKLIIKSNLLNELKNYDIEILMTIGAGDIDTLVEPIKKMLDNRQ
ncbi:MAG: UDP-N-acetylmuramate--L-alanine ligase [Saprospiraceae bacterium]|nr:UDP-N-acetylmuramate--L-alanine ligase [Saprospiraceae bacterium]